MPNTTDLSGFKLPDITKPDMSFAGGSTPQYSDVMGQIQKAGNLPTITGTVMPSIQALLDPAGQKLSPYAKALDVRTNQNVAQVQTDMMKRGLTGSDIEATAMGGARAAGQDAIANMYAQTADQLSQMIYQAATGDINNNRELLLTLAQAMGQELTSQRDMQMFKEALQASLEEAEKSRRFASNAAKWGAVGTIGGTLLGGSMGGIQGAQLGGTLGGVAGKGFANG